MLVIETIGDVISLSPKIKIIYAVIILIIVNMIYLHTTRYFTNPSFINKRMHFSVLAVNIYSVISVMIDIML